MTPVMRTMTPPSPSVLHDIQVMRNSPYHDPPLPLSPQYILPPSMQQPAPQQQSQQSQQQAYGSSVQQQQVMQV